MPPLNTFEKTAIAVILSQAVIVPAANAATINVGVGGCTLANAIRSANDDVAVGGCSVGTVGADTINIPNQTIVFTSADVDGAIYGDSALPLIESEITIEGDGSTLERGSVDPFRIIATDSSSSAFLTLNSITLTNGFAVDGFDGYGGAVYVGANSSVTINNSTIKDSSALYAGGGVYAYGSATVQINNSTISGNSAGIGGGVWANDNVDIAISESVVTGNSANGGGGIYVYDGSIATLINTTVSNNTAVSYGGGINAERAVVNISNSTISGNNANSKGSGFYLKESILVMKNATVSSNSTVSSMSFSGDSANPTNATLFNTVVENSPGNIDCYYIQGVGVTLSVDASNWIESATCNSPSSGDPMLGLLADNGGSTETHLPLMGSGLEGAGALSVCGPSPVAGRDQRGDLRGTDSCFIGAVEPFADGSSNFFVVPLPSGKSVIFGL